MLRPNQFEVNEAWIAFRINSAPIRTEQDGNFNCIALMDAASCFILGSDLFPLENAVPPQLQVRQLLRKCQEHKQQLPRTLYVPSGDVAELVVHEAARQNIDVVQVSERDLLIFIGEARQSFSEQFEDVARDA